MRLSNPVLLVFAFALLLSVSAAGPVAGAWYDGGIPVGSTYQAETAPEIAPDGEGGAIIVFIRYAADQDIYAQRVDAWGNLLWTPGGVAVCTASDNQLQPRIVADGEGGAIIVWRDDRGADMDIYAQRLDADGAVLWTAGGEAVVSASGNQTDAVLAPDGTGGAIVAWVDARGANTDIYAQLIDRNGDYQWTKDGIVICGAANNQSFPNIVPDEAGGAVVAWFDSRTAYDIYIQRVDALGSVYWDADGEVVRTAPPYPNYMALISDGSGGALIAWDEDTGPYTDVRAQWIDFHGDLKWGTDGVAFGPTGVYQSDAWLAPDGAGGAFVTWRDNRGADTDIYIQHVSALGGKQWTSDGVPVCTATGTQYYAFPVPDGEGGVIVSWLDRRTGDEELYIQHISPAGTASWDSNGVLVATDLESSVDYRVTGDDAGNAIFAYEDTRGGDAGIFAQRMDWSGNWGNRAPYIASAEDVPGDQGGYVNVQWDASPVDPPPYELIVDYTVWRAIEQGPLTASLLGGRPVLENILELMPGALVDGAVRIEQLANGSTYYWELVGTVEAYGLHTYAYPAETLFDSTSVCPDRHYFQVIAHGAGAGEFWISNTVFARSVDNLAPEAPLNLAGDYQTPPGELLMSWDPNMEVDLSNYAVYRGATEDFVPDAGNMIGAPTDTFFVDTEFNAGAQEYYKVSALDIHENESGYALLRPEDISGVDPGVPLVTALEQNVPNPFSPETVIRFSLAERGHVSLRVYDVQGRPVRTLVNGEIGPDRYEAGWEGLDDSGRRVGPGVYFYKLEAPGYARTMKMVLLK